MADIEDIIKQAAMDIKAKLLDEMDDIELPKFYFAVTSPDNLDGDYLKGRLAYVQTKWSRDMGIRAPRKGMSIYDMPHAAGTKHIVLIPEGIFTFDSCDCMSVERGKEFESGDISTLLYPHPKWESGFEDVNNYFNHWKSAMKLIEYVRRGVHQRNSPYNIDL